MTKAWAWACHLLLLVTADAAVIPSGSFAHTSTTSSALPSSPERSQTPVTFLKQRMGVRKYQRSSTEDETRLEASLGRQQDGPAQDQMRALLTTSTRPYVEIPFAVATTTVVQTVTVEVAIQTKIVFRPIEKTLTFTNPVVVFETRAFTAPQSSKTIAARGKTNTAAFHQESLPETLPVYSHQPKEDNLFSRPARVERQALGQVTSVSTVTVGMTTTVTNFGSIRTITVFSPVFVIPTTLSTGTTASLPSANPTPSSGKDDKPTDTATFTSGLELTSTATLFAPSDTSADAGVTTWFSTPSDPGALRPTESPAASSRESGSDSTATAAPAAPTPEPASEPALSPATIASISLGALTGLLFLLFLGFVYRSYRKYAKNRQRNKPSEEDYQMTSAATAATIMNQPALASPSHDSQGGATPGEASSKRASEAKQVRIVIRPIVKRQSAGSESSKGSKGSGEAQPRRENWQRGSGYTSQGGYSVSVAGGSDSTLRDATGWSNRSEYGSTIKRAASQDGDIPELPALGGAARMKERH
ncbi:hypothetical protein LZ32DRAFT_666918 [Colletotrichum eremochloae]|nr:hypothetical protein LZ32DRAFT_666918 [Colletotrichum eremochloae]